jgi:hypothetical protein
MLEGSGIGCAGAGKSRKKEEQAVETGADNDINRKSKRSILSMDMSMDTIDNLHVYRIIYIACVV